MVDDFHIDDLSKDISNTDFEEGLAEEAAKFKPEPVFKNLREKKKYLKQVKATAITKRIKALLDINEEKQETIEDLEQNIYNNTDKYIFFTGSITLILIGLGLFIMGFIRHAMFLVAGLMFMIIGVMLIGVYFIKGRNKFTLIIIFKNKGIKRIKRKIEGAKITFKNKGYLIRPASIYFHKANPTSFYLEDNPEPINFDNISNEPLISPEGLYNTWRSKVVTDLLSDNTVTTGQKITMGLVGLILIGGVAVWFILTKQSSTALNNAIILLPITKNFFTLKMNERALLANLLTNLRDLFIGGNRGV